MTKDRKKKPQRDRDTQRPSQIVSRWKLERSQLHRMPVRVHRNHHYANRKHDEPAIVDAHGNSVNTRDQNLSFEKRFEVHARKQRAKGEVQRVKPNVAANLTNT